ncbi:MAG: tRNA 2-thiouridine(34) synthase MnmA, partial [Candidatus Omnitrophota bacterium]|nr:tRNA 2-thiouridine(34) synthase MnmA [Candidatus Omnitrophota bacterium]
LGIAYKEPLYVTGIDTAKNAIIAGTKEAVTKKVFIAKEPNWVGVSGLTKPSRLFVKIRYGHKKSKALVEVLDNNELRITFEKPQEAITPGQAAVLYKGDVVIAGAWISEVLE